ncbi:hypothetical protein [Rothia kristinae]|nr:hypothetical protein [Rothia kristinae]
MGRKPGRRGWLIGGSIAGVAVILALVLGVAVMVKGTSGKQEAGAGAPTLPASVSAPPATASSGPPVSEEEAKKSSRYGSFGGPVTSGEVEAYNEGRAVTPTPVESFEGWDNGQVQQAKDLGLEAMKAYTAKVSMAEWHERMDPMGTDNFRAETKRFNPHYTTVEQVQGVTGVQTSDNPQLIEVTVGTDKGPFTVRIARASVGSKMLVDHIEPEDPRAVYGG